MQASVLDSDLVVSVKSPFLHSHGGTAPKWSTNPRPPSVPRQESSKRLPLYGLRGISGLDVRLPTEGVRHTMDQVIIVIRYVTLLIGLLVLVDYLFFNAPEFCKTVFGSIGLTGYIGFLLGVGGWVWVGYGLVHQDSLSSGEIVSVLLLLWGGMIGAMLIGHYRRETTNAPFEGQNETTPSSTATHM